MNITLLKTFVRKMFATNFVAKAIISVVLLIAVSIQVASFILPQTHQAQAAINLQINYQGKLTNTSDVAVANGDYNMEFILYDAPSGGTTLWTETRTGANKVTVTNGLFSVMLGSVTALTGVDFNQTVYLGVNIGGTGSPSWDGEMTPRKTIGSVPSAFLANGVVGTGGVRNTIDSATALTIAKAGSNYALQVDTSAGSAATGLKVTSNAASSGLALAVISSGSNENLTIDAKGSGTISLGATSTGNLILGGSTGDILLGGGSGSTGCTVTNSTGAFACTAGGSFTTLGLTGAVSGGTSFTGSTFVKAPYIYGGDMTTTYGGYSGGVFGGTTTHAVLDFVDNGSRVGEFYTTSSTFNFFTDVGKALNFYTNADYGGAPAFGIDTSHQVILSSLDTDITAPTTSGTTRMVITDANGQLSFTSAAVPSGTNTGDVTLAAFGSTANANGASLSGQALTLQPASASFPGGVSTTTQSFAGDKTFVNNTTFTGTTTQNNTATFNNDVDLVFAGTENLNLTSTITGTTAVDLFSTTVTNQTSSGTQRGIVLTNANDAANAVTENLILIDNAETTASTLTDAILITSSGVNDGITDAIDASASNITNAINIGANAIAGTNFNVSAAGAIVGVGVNAGAGLIQGTGGLTLTGAVSITNNGSSTIDLNTGTSTGLVTIGGGSGAFSLQTTNIDISNTGAITNATGFNGLIVTANTGVITTGTWNGTAIVDTYVADTLTVDSSSSVHWNALNNYPAACSAGSAISQLADTTNTCTAFNTDTSITLQDAYGAGNSIETASNTSVVITETTTGAVTGDLLQLTVNQATGGTYSGDALQITMDGFDANAYTGNGINIIIDQSQNTGSPILVQDDAAVTLFQLNENGAITLGAASAETTAITITDTDYTNALSIGDNNITGTTYTVTGTTATIDFTNFDVSSAGALVAVGVNSGSGLLQGTGGLTLTGAVSITNNGSSTIDLNTGTSTGLVTIGGGSGAFSLQTTNIDISNTGAITNATGFNGLIVTANTGVITTGTWNGTAVGAQYGGTGLNTSASSGVPSINSGTWSANAITPNGVMYGGASNALSFTAVGSTGQCLVGNTGAAPSWSSCAGLVTLQAAYDATSGNTITTTTARNIAFTLADVVTPTSFTIENQDTAATSAQRIFNSIASGTATNGLLIEQTGAGTLTNGIQIAETAGTITDGILITGTLGNILNSGSIDITGAGAITGATGISSSGNYVQSAGTFSLTSANTTQTTTSSAAAINVNSLTTGTGLYIASSSLSSGKLIDLQVSGTAAASNTQTVLNVATSGANGTSTQTTYGGYFSNTHTGTASTNVAAYFTASGGANNYAAIFNGGNVGVNTTTPTQKLEVSQGNIKAVGVQAPTGFSGTATTGGSLATNNYYYAITSVDATGESSPIYTYVNVGGANNAVNLSWTASPLATSYNIYRSTSPGGAYVSYSTASTTYSDTGASGGSSSPPVSNTASGALQSNMGINVYDSTGVALISNSGFAGGYAIGPRLNVVGNYFSFGSTGEGGGNGAQLRVYQGLDIAGSDNTYVSALNFKSYYGDAATFSAQPRSGQLFLSDAGSSNRFYAYPGVVDGASAVGYTLDTSNSLANASAKLLAVRNQGSEKVTVLANGNFGIGTTAPSSSLHVVKADNGTDDIVKILANNLTQGIGISYNTITAIGSNTDQNIIITPKGAGDIITTAGTLGVGYTPTTGTATLMVNGGAAIGDGTTLDATIPTNGLLVKGSTSIGSTTATSMFNVGTAAQFQVNSSGAIAAATGVTSSGTITFSGLGGGGTKCVQTDNSGVITAAAAACGSGGGLTVGSTAISSGTAGRILFEGSGNVLQEAAGLAWDNTDASLVLSTSSTTASNKALSVSQTGGTTGTDYAGYFSNTGSATTNIAGYFTASGATNNYAAIFDAGNVGIGTTTPTNLSGTYFGTNQVNPLWVSANDGSKVTSLVVQGNLGEAIQFVDQTGAAEADFGVYTTDLYFVNRQASGGIRFVNATSTAMYIDPSSNVGIGTGVTSLPSLLSVGTSSVFQVNSSGAIAAATGILSSGTIRFSSLTSNGPLYTSAGNGTLTTTAPTSGAIGYWSRSSTTISPTTANDIILQATANTTGADLGITNTGVYTGTGIFNLTANSATTGTLAAITGNALTTGSLLSLSSSSAAATTGQKGLNVALTGALTGAQTTYGGYLSNTRTGASAVNVGLYSTASGATGGNYAAIFDAGNVGIGTTTPTSKLVISGGSGYGSIYNDVSGINPSLILAGDAAIGYYPTLDFRPNDSTSAGGMLQSYSSSGGLYFTLRGSGGALRSYNYTNTTTNSIVDQFVSSSNSTGAPTSNFGTGILLQGESSTTNDRDMARLATYWTTATDASRTSNLGFYTVNSAAALAEKMTLQGDGNLGIGDTTPTALLTVGSGDLFQVNSSGAIAAATGILSSGTIRFSSLTSNGPLYTSAGNGTLTTTAPTSGAIGYWSRSSTTISPTTANDIILQATTNTTGADLGITNTGVYTGTGIFNLTANSATTGTLAAITGNALTTGSLLSLSSSSAAATTGQKGLNVALTGALTGAQTTYGGYFSNTRTGASAVNVGLYSTASGATGGNYAAIFDAGNVGIGITSPATKLDIDSNSNTSSLRIRGAAETTEIADIYVGASGKLLIDTTAGSAGQGFIELKGEDDQYGVIIRDSNGASTGYANLFMNDTTNDTLNICLNCTSNTPGMVLYEVGAGDYRLGLTTLGPDRRLDSLDASNPQIRLTTTDGSVYSDLQNTATANLIVTGDSLTSSSTKEYGLQISPVINQTSTASYTALDINVTETAATTLNGLNRLADFRVGSSSKLAIANDGSVTLQNASSLTTAYGGFGKFENHLTKSEEFDHANWTKSSVTAPTANAQTAPDGSSTAESLATSGSGGYVQQDTSTAVSSTDYTFSVWARSASGTQSFSMRVDGTTTGTGTEVTHTATTSWQRFSVTQAVGSFTGNVRVRIYPGTSGSTGTIYAWGAQVEKSSVPNTYAKTTTAGLTNDASRGLIVNNNLKNTTASGFLYGGRQINVIDSTTAGTHVGQFIRMVDNTSLDSGQTVRGLEVQAYSGTNVNGTNTGIAAYGYTFGIQATTTSQAAAQATPAAIFADLDNGTDATTKTRGNAIRAYTDNATSADLVSFYQETSTYTGNGLLMNFGNGGGSFSGNFMNLQNAATSKYTISSTGRHDLLTTDADNVISLYINSEESTVTQTLFAIESDTVANGQSVDTVKAHFEADGSLFVSLTGTQNTIALCHANNGQSNNDEIVDCSGAPSDVAEYFGSEDPTLGAGEIVVVGKEATELHLDGYHTSKAWVARSTGAYQNTLMGVISTAPAAVYGDEIFSASDNPRPVALAGRVPVKVNLENGPIKAGDFITSSSVPGIGMKAVKAGPVIGQALNDYDGTGNGMVVIFVKATNYSGVSIDEQISGLVFDYSNPIQSAQTSGQILEYLLTQLANLDSDNLSQVHTDVVIANGEIITPTVTTQTLRTDFLSSAAADGGLSVASTTMFNGGLMVDSIHSIGDLISFQNDVEFFGTPYFTSDTAGFAVIKAGVQTVDVRFTREYLAQPIVNASFTFEQEADLSSITDSQALAAMQAAQIASAQAFLGEGVTFAITNKTKEGFTIVLNKAAATDVKFSWTALAVRNASTFMSIDATPETPPVVEPPVGDVPTDPETPPATVPDPAP